MSAHSKQSSASAYSADRPVFVISVAAELAVVAAPAVVVVPEAAAPAAASKTSSRTTWTAESGRRANHPIVGSGRGPRAVGRSWRRPRVAHRTRGRRPVVFRGGGPLR